jgi:PPM family protein phosphatase
MDFNVCGAPESDRQPPRSSKRGLVTLTVRAAGRTDRGHVRATNEDQLLVTPPVTLRAEPSGARICSRLLVVADGMGGHAGGELASSIAVRTVCSTFLPIVESLPSVCRTGDHLEACVLAELRRAVERAHMHVRDEAAHRPELADMGTTLTLAYIHGSRLFVAHAGDSRCYLLRGGMLSQVTRDHTLVNELIRSGFLESASDLRGSMRSVLTNAVGGTDSPVTVDVHHLHLRPGDVLLLCTDGLHGMISDAEILTALSSYSEPQRAAYRLVAAALAAGGADNVTALVARCDESSACG